MRTKIRRWGNSLALRIPRSFAEEVGIYQDVPVEVSIEDGQLVVEPVARPTYTLENLLAQVREDNLHGEVKTGPALGNEAW